MTVYLVGAGPGDPGLLTRRGAELLARADVVVHDRLSAAELLDLAPPGAERIDVGKAPRRHRLSQDDINDLLVLHGRAGRTVVRLKGGDPFVFARGSEEAHALIEAGVPFEIVPGVTSALAVPAYAGIPVTQRFSSTAFTVITGHEDPSSGEGTVDWAAAAQLGGTLVILMGVGRWPAIAAALLSAGMPADTPAAAVRWGTRPEQHTVRATLATLADHPLAAPSVIVVGAVAAEDLRWFEARPLFGRTVVVTRSQEQSSVLAARLVELGASVIEAPAIEIVPPVDGGVALDRALHDLTGHRWLVLTSPNGVRAVMDRVPDARSLAGVRIAVIGSGTADALRAHRIVPDLVPDRFVAEGLLDVFPAPTEPGERVLLAQAEQARPAVAQGLAALGYEVDVVHAYRSAPVNLDDETRRAVLTADAITFTSSSTVTNLCAQVDLTAASPAIISIGPITSRTADDHGLVVVDEADPHDLDGLVAAVVRTIGADDVS